MLQQTQVATVIGYFDRFMHRFPDVRALASASEDQVLQYWTGLGYYARARNLYRAAQHIFSEHGGRCPTDYAAWEALPGIGRSTAGAIMALAFDRRHAILDGNVKRVMARFYAVEGWPGNSRISAVLWDFAERNTPSSRVRDYTQAIMDLGAGVCRRMRPACRECPLKVRCLAHVGSLTDRLPSPKPKCDRPVRTTRFVIVRNRWAGVRLARRPGSGVWGGLYGFPEIPSEANPVEWCRTAIGGRIRSHRELPTFDHAFTHFTLRISPVLIELEEIPGEVRDDDGELWYLAGGGREIGLPTPVRDLLAQIEQEGETE